MQTRYTGQENSVHSSITAHLAQDRRRSGGQVFNKIARLGTSPRPFFGDQHIGLNDSALITNRQHCPFTRVTVGQVYVHSQTNKATRAATTVYFYSHVLSFHQSPLFADRIVPRILTLRSSSDSLHSGSPHTTYPPENDIGQSATAMSIESPPDLLKTIMGTPQ